MKKLLYIIPFALLLLSCSGDDEFEFNPANDAVFSDSEVVVLNQALTLDANPYNYANMALPNHYTGAEANESDNTPGDNEITNMGATLGRVLFYDINLSENNTISCASCHQQSAAFSDPRKFSVGLNGELTRRNSMTLINTRFYENGRFFWDERAATLEEQALMPIKDHIEMNMSLSNLETKLAALDYYPILFKHAFGNEEVTSDKIAKALAQYMRTIVATQSRFDEGFAAAGFPRDEEQMPDFPNFTAQENLGLDIFYRGRNGATCLYCHGSPQHVNDEAKNNGLELSYTDNGLGEFTNNPNDNAKFKVPSLRNIENTAPYMHDGRFETLEEVIEHYSDNVANHPNLNFRLKTLDDGQVGVAEVLKLNLTDDEKAALKAFLLTLTDEQILNDPKYSDPFK